MTSSNTQKEPMVRDALSLAPYVPEAGWFQRLSSRLRLRHIGATILLLKAALVIFIAITILPSVNLEGIFTDQMFWIFVGAGFAAQLIDGTLGMAYGISCTSLLLHFGISPKVATAAVHTAEVFTTGVSGLSHIRFRNLDKDLFLRVALFGIMGAVAGAWIVSAWVQGDGIKPFVSAYLLILGAVLVVRAIRNKQAAPARRQKVGVLALTGGLLDAIGGGGWGPIVTSNLVHRGHDPRRVIGTVNTAEFFVTLASTTIFIWLLGAEMWKILIALVIGGTLAAPLGAYMAARINKRLFMFIIGIAIILISLLALYKHLS